jgi:hypothetical protein
VVLLLYLKIWINVQISDKAKKVAPRKRSLSSFIEILLFLIEGERLFIYPNVLI